MLPNRFADDLTDRKTGRKAGKRILEDDLHFCTHLAHLFGRKVINLFSVKQHLSAGFFAGQTQDGTSGRRLAAAGLAYQTHGGSAL